MTRILFLILTLFVHGCFAVDLPVTPPPQLNAKAWLLLDLQSGQTLAENDADRRMEPASLTK